MIPKSRMYFFGITNFFETMFYAAITLFIHGEKNMYMANRKINKHNMNLNYCSSIFCGEMMVKLKYFLTGVLWNGGIYLGLL
jgi:hypothetical protein